MWIMMVNWKFSWIGSKNVYALVGHAIVNPDSTHITPFTPFKVDIIMPNPKLRLISSPLDASRFPQGKYQRHKCARYDLYLVALETPLAEYEKMFSESEDTDAVLVVEDKRLHVNKEVTHFFSEFFSTVNQHFSFWAFTPPISLNFSRNLRSQLKILAMKILVFSWATSTQKLSSQMVSIIFYWKIRCFYFRLHCWKDSRIGCPLQSSSCSRTCRKSTTAPFNSLTRKTVVARR